MSEPSMKLIDLVKAHKYCYGEELRHCQCGQVTLDDAEWQEHFAHVLSLYVAPAPQSDQLGPNVYRGDDGVDRVLGISSGSLPQSDQPAQGGKRLSNDAFIDFRDDGYVSFSGRTIMGELTTLVLSPEEFSMLSIVLSAPASQQVAPALEGLREAASKFAARVRERCPEWFEESDTDFSEADHALRAALESASAKLGAK